MKRAVLAGICLKAKKNEFEAAMAECENLCQACGIEVAARCTQQSDTADRNTAFRQGKVQELAATVAQAKADGVVFYNPLTFRIAQRLSEACGVDVIDRTALILDIFSLRARSRPAKIQTEVARLQYQLPQLLANDMEEDHARGGTYNNRGAGEKRSDIIQRRYEAHINDLKRELKQLQAHQQTEQTQRHSSHLKSAALVGYTNAGKSSIMNALLARNNKTEKQVLEKDMLFATLDTSIRSITWNSRQFLLYDTVGFVSDLPHELIDAFKSTLDAARDADLLIHVIDASDPLWQAKVQITNETLQQIHADHIPVLRVFNKIDLAKEPEKFTGIRTSCKNGQGLDALLDALIETLYPAEAAMTCLLPYAKIGLIDAGRKTLDIQIGEQREDGMILELRGPKEQMQPFDPYRIK